MALVSVVIPTLGRPALLLRAIESVFNQTYKQIELIVVVDGPDTETLDALRSVKDSRLEVIINARSLTAAGARNVGADRAKGEWIAFLDDDDEWLSSKLERQVMLARDCAPVLVTCLSQVVTPIATYVWPRTIYDNSIPVDEYLFDRRSLFAGESHIQTSSYLLRRSVFDEVRFDVESPHDDWDFLLRLAMLPELRIKTVPEILAVLHIEEQRLSLAHTTSWTTSLEWIDKMRPLITARSYSGFCLGVAGSRAAKERAYSAFPRLLNRAFKFGSPRLAHVALYLAFWLAPEQVRRQVRAMCRLT